VVVRLLTLVNGHDVDGHDPALGFLLQHELANGS